MSDMENREGRSTVLPIRGCEMTRPLPIQCYRNSRNAVILWLSLIWFESMILRCELQILRISKGFAYYRMRSPTTVPLLGP